MKIKSTPYIVVYFIGGQHVVVLPFEEFPNGIGPNDEERLATDSGAKARSRS